MAGAPFRRLVLGLLAKRATDSLGPDATPLLYAVAWLGSGGTMRALAESLEVDCSTSFIANVLRGLEPNAAFQLSAARRGGAAYLEERSIPRVSVADATPAQGALAL